MSIEQQRYLAYMLRLWQVSSDREPIWRASVESPHSGERHGFANLEMLFAFLEAKCQEQPEDVSEFGPGLPNHTENRQGGIW
jgi:hypothetical protein